LCFAEVVASLEWLDVYLRRITAVTAEDVQRVAQTYLRRDQATVGWYVGNASSPIAGGRRETEGKR